MPRPGPRPYECVRRAWHSDRHQPIRGSLIQEIFRVVHEIHNSSTKKNKEWQEILPVVVLKTEEILYSKATNEAEYMDFSTLRDRLMDAINTIIRLDESTETGDFLHPCIEAALNLGCTPRKASRSQRNNISTNYLSFRNQDSPTLSPPPMTVRNSPCVPYFWSLAKPVANDLGHSGFRCQCLLPPAHTSTSPKFPALLTPYGLMENVLPSSKFSVYPLYYGNGVRERQHSAIEITPISTPVMEKTSASGSPCDDKCDLALRLGPLAASSSRSYGNKTPLHVLGSGSSSDDCSPMMERKVPLIPMVNSYGLSEHNTFGRNLEDECFDAETRMRKRKADCSHSLNWLPKLPSSRFIG
ncbi:hypothetical protein SDJN02_07845 [Cucurbita argyrosperma subsp. argyrosperma]|nr:hypothetical protein SDJN02_07845 [Cucurbita argyrosperma subsp. argyrosperma]